VHRLVQAVIRHRLPPDRQRATAERVVALLAAVTPGDPEDPAGWAAYARLAPHVLATASMGDDHPATRQLVLDTTRYLRARGDSHGSRAVCEPLLDRWRSLLGPDHPDTLAAANILALALLLVGAAQGVRALSEDTLPRCRRVLGPDHPTTLTTAGALMHALAWSREIESTRVLGEDTLPRCRRVFGPDHARTLTAATALTFILVQRGEAEHARALGQDTPAAQPPSARPGPPDHSRCGRRPDRRPGRAG
jgi:hypothetical protein